MYVLKFFNECKLIFPSPFKIYVYYRQLFINFKTLKLFKYKQYITLIFTYSYLQTVIHKS